MSGERISEIGGFWLSYRARSPFLHITWFDTDTRQTKRLSTGTTDLRAAQIKLAEHLTLHAKREAEKPEDMPIATILTRYYEEHGKHLPSVSTVRHAMQVWNEFWQEACVSDLTVQQQEAFIRHMKRQGFKNSYVSRCIGVGRAALRRAWKRGELTSVPFIFDERDRSDEEKAPLLSIKEVAALIATARDRRPQIYWFINFALNTLARPDAILDLRPAHQVNEEGRLINMNPKGRKQTKKGRPVVPITDHLLPFIQTGPVIFMREDIIHGKSIEPTRETRYINWRGKPVNDVFEAFKRVVEDARMADGKKLNPKITAYSFRRTMATELRKRGVPRWEVEGFLGHKMPGETDEYAEFAPDYLMIGRQKIDEYMSEVSVALALHDNEIAAKSQRLRA